MNEKLERAHHATIVYVTTLSIIIMCLIFGLAIKDKLMLNYKSEAVKRGYAEWKVNPQNGSTSFQWIEND